MSMEESIKRLLRYRAFEERQNKKRKERNKLKAFRRKIKRGK